MRDLRFHGKDSSRFRVITTYEDLKQAWGNPVKTTEVQAKILAKKGLLLSWHRKIYKYMAENLSKETVNIEIGSGSSKLYEHISGLIRSNIIFIKKNDIAFSAYQIPFMDGSVGNIILIDVLHHLHDPHAFFREAERVLKPGGRILICDPYLSTLSYPIWKYLHPENCDCNHLGFNKQGKINPLIDANSANASLLFFSDKDPFSKICRCLTVKKTVLHSKFHYWIAGGYSFPQFLPTVFAPLIDLVERVLAPFDKWLASFMFVIIEKKKENYV